MVNFCLYSIYIQFPLKTDAVDRPDLNTPRKREIETAVASPNQQQIPSVNKAGRDIYYPPGHEMMLTKRQEMHASGSQAGVSKILNSIVFEMVILIHFFSYVFIFIGTLGQGFWNV